MDSRRDVLESHRPNVKITGELIASPQENKKTRNAPLQTYPRTLWLDEFFRGSPGSRRCR